MATSSRANRQARRSLMEAGAKMTQSKDDGSHDATHKAASQGLGSYDNRYRGQRALKERK